jgi:DNA-binding CsgD family transcriptional regulator
MSAILVAARAEASAHSGGQERQIFSWRFPLRRSPDAVLVGAPVPSLVPWGRSPDADLVYRRVITFGPATTGELGKELGLPARRIAAALDELATVDAIRPRPESSRDAATWIATPPAEVLASLRRSQRSAAPPVAQPSPVDHLVHGAEVRHLPTRAQARVRLGELMAVSSHEHLAMNPEQTFDPESARSGLPMDRMLLRRGVRMRVLGVHPADTDQLAPYGRTPDEPQPEYRSTSSVPMKLVIVDRKVALFPVDPGNVERGYLEMAQQPVVTALANLFEQHWETARDPWEWAIPQAALTPREHKLITLLTQGHTDASAARRLHIGVRTVTTVMRSLMDRFGVDNRFQLGLVLGALGAAKLPGTDVRHQEQQ